MSSVERGVMKSLWPHAASLSAERRPPGCDTGHVAAPLDDAALPRLVLVSLGALAVLAALFAFRALDDNRLVSWQWVFSARDLAWLVPALFLALPFAYALARLSWVGRGVAPILFLTALLTAMFSWSVPEVIVDSARYFVQAKYLEQHGFGYFLAQWGREIPAWTDLPLVPLLYGAMFHFFGESRFAIQALTALLFAGSVVLTFRIGTVLWDRATGACGAVLLFAMPYLWTQAPMMLVDVPTMFFFTLATVSLLAALERGGPVLLALAAAALAAVLLSKYSAWLALALLPAMVWLRTRSVAPVSPARVAVIALGAAVPVGAFLLWKADVIVDQLALLWSYQVPGLGRWEESLVSTFLFQIHPFITVAALGTVGLAVVRRDVRLLMLGVLLLAVILEVRRARYIIIVLPVLALLAAYGLGSLRDALTRRFVVSCAVATTMIVVMGGFLPFLQATSAMNLPRAGALLDALAGEEVEVVVLPPVRSAVNPAISVPILDLYTRKRIVYRLELSSLPRPEPAALAVSPVRFTWELPTPPFFGATAQRPLDDIPVVVIMSMADQPLPVAVTQRLLGYRLMREFAGADTVFRHQTLVRIYVPA